MAPQDERSGFDHLAQEARKDARMLKADQPIAQEDFERVRESALRYIAQRKMATGNRYSQADFCADLGPVKVSKNQPPRNMPNSSLSGFLNSKPTPDEYVRRIDEFLDTETVRSQTLKVQFAEIGLAKKVFGVMECARSMGSIALVIMEPGDGKTTIARAFRATRDNVVMVTIQEKAGHAAEVIKLLYRAMGLTGATTFAARRDAVVDRMHRNRSLCVLIDEAQKLKPSGLEMLRDLHDGSDESGDGGVAFVMFADHDFYRLVLRSKYGQISPIKPQMTRRMFPVFDSRDMVDPGGKGRGERKLYSEQDLVRILRNQQLRLVSPDGIRWLSRIANMRGHGSLGTAIALCRLAYALAGGAQGNMIETKHLYQAMEMGFSTDDARAILDEVEVVRNSEAKAATA